MAEEAVVESGGDQFGWLVLADAYQRLGVCERACVRVRVHVCVCVQELLRVYYALADACAASGASVYAVGSISSCCWSINRCCWSIQNCCWRCCKIYSASCRSGRIHG